MAAVARALTNQFAFSEIEAVKARGKGAALSCRDSLRVLHGGPKFGSHGQAKLASWGRRFLVAFGGLRHGGRYLTTVPFVIRVQGT